MTQTVYDDMYDKFIDKVKDRRKIPCKEFHKIMDEIVEQNPIFRNYIHSVALTTHGWETRVISEGNKSDIYMVKRT